MMISFSSKQQIIGIFNTLLCLQMSPLEPSSPQTMDKFIDTNEKDVVVDSTSSRSTTTTTTTEPKLNTTSSGSTYTTNWTSSSSLSSSFSKPHTNSNDPYWNAVRNIHPEGGMFSLQDLTFIKKLGSGDIGTVYLVELKGAIGCMFAAKVMDKEELCVRSKESRAKIERDVLEMLDHPFLPVLYATLDSGRWFCLLTEFCSGGDLHVLRQRQPQRRFDEVAVRFYASEIVAAMEYLHMLGVVYGDLKPENVLVRSDGHIMLTDFDLCLLSGNLKSSAQLVSTNATPSNQNCAKQGSFDVRKFTKSSCILSYCVAPAVTCVTCIQPSSKKKKKPTQQQSLELVVEPTDARSLSFVGTHEYLAPEIVSGEGHGNSVDWWTLGIFIFEMFYGVTPFRGQDNEVTLANILARALEFPKEPALSSAAKGLITQLLIKNPAKRMGSTMGATAVKNHPFFDGVNWALLRCTKPPHVPEAYNNKDITSSREYDASVEYY